MPTVHIRSTLNLDAYIRLQIADCNHLNTHQPPPSLGRVYSGHQVLCHLRSDCVVTSEVMGLIPDTSELILPILMSNCKQEDTESIIKLTHKND